MNDVCLLYMICNFRGQFLAPILFLIYIDRDANCVSSSSIAMYADDIALYRSISLQYDSKLQEDVNSLYSWISHNHLKLNAQKCCYMTFSRKHSPTLPNTTLTIDDNVSLSRANTLASTSQVISPGPSILILHVINRENSLVCSTGASTNTRNLTLPQNYTNH